MGTLNRWYALTKSMRRVGSSGDSTAFGLVGNVYSYIDQLRVALGDYFHGNPGYGYVAPWRAASLGLDTQLTYLDTIADWTAGGPAAADHRVFYNAAEYRTGYTGTIAVKQTRQPAQTIHHFDVYFVDATGAGDVEVSIDSKAYFTRAMGAVGDHDLKKVTVAQPVANDVRIRPHAGSVLVFGGLNLWSRTRPAQGCETHNIARGGTRLANFILDPLTLRWFDLMPLDLLLLGPWTNDMDPGSNTIDITNYLPAVAAYQTNLQTEIDAAGAQCDVLILAPYEQDHTRVGRPLADDQVIQAAFRQACIDVAAANTHVDVLNLYTYFGTFAQATAAGLLADNLHESQAGQDLIFELLNAKVTIGATRATPIVQVVEQPTSNALLDRTFRGVRSDGFTFNIVDAARQSLGVLDVEMDSPPTVRNDTTRTSFRTVEGLNARNKPSDLDLRRHRLQVAMTLQNGDTFPLGVFMFGQNDVRPSTASDGWAPQLFDENFLLNQGLDRSWSLPKGGSLLGMFVAMVGSVLDPLGVPTSYAVADQPAGSPVTFPVGSFLLPAANALAALLGCFAPFFAGDGTHTLKPATVIDANTPMDHLYEIGPKSRIFDSTVTQTDTLFEAFNRFIVTGDQLGSGVPVRGVYDLPASAPHSYGQTGQRITAPVHSVAGLSSQALAQVMAYVDAVSDRSSYRHGSFSAIADPRHDTFDTFQLLGAPYLETAWSLSCIAGGDHAHEGIGLWT